VPEHHLGPAHDIGPANCALAWWNSRIGFLARRRVSGAYFLLKLLLQPKPIRKSIGMAVSSNPVQ
jgi:hypothetical protein